MKNTLLSILILLSLSLSAQTIIINGEQTDRPLRWDDFTGTPDYSTNLYAYTYWYVSYQWAPFQFKGDTAKLKVEVSPELERRSWKKADKVSDSLLEHEQGHFNTGRLFYRCISKKSQHGCSFPAYLRVPDYTNI